MSPDALDREVLRAWQMRMADHDAKWTARMQEDVTNIATGRKTFQELREAAGAPKLPFELWLEEKEIIRADRP